MSVTCSTCRGELPVDAKRTGPIRCPWCGVRFTLAPARPAAPPRSRSRAPDAGEPKGLIIGLFTLAGVLALALLMLVGLCWRLASRSAGNREALASAPAVVPRENPAPVGGEVAMPNPKPVEQHVGPSRPPDAPAIGPALESPLLLTFLDTPVSGNRVCIIADTSGSMKTNNRLEQVKRELKSTLGGLGAEQQFYLTFFHSKAEPMPEKTWLRGKEASRILPWIDSQKPRGSTQPMPAFEVALKLDPKPDMMIFMTDGAIPKVVPNEVAQLNPKRVPIHTILFSGEGSVLPGNASEKTRERMRASLERMRKQAEPMLEQIARDSGGSYRFVRDDRPTR